MQKTGVGEFARVIAALLIREMITRYGRSPGGYLWAIVEPAGMILILAFAISQFVHAPPLGTSFVLFYASGYLPFHAFNDIAAVTGQSVHVNRQLLHLPRVRPLDTVIARFVLSVLTLTFVAGIIIGVLLIGSGTAGHFDPAPLIAGLGAAAVLGFGIGTLNAALFQFVPLWERLWPIINRPLFLISAIFYTAESMPGPVQALLSWNPIVHLVGTVRQSFYPHWTSDFANLGYVLAWSAVSFMIGAGLMLRHASRFIEDV